MIKRRSYSERIDEGLRPDKMDMDCVNNRSPTPSTADELTQDTLGSLPDLSTSHTPGGRFRHRRARQRSGDAVGEDVLSPVLSPGHHTVHTQISSVPSSNFMFAEPTQTLIVFDWDDTLFPTTELFDRMRFSSKETSQRPKLPLKQEKLLDEWREALRNYLEEATRLSDMVAIVTNSKRPWITNCLERFAPDLLPIFTGPRAPKIVYAFEHLPESKKVRSQCMNLRPVKHREIDLNQISQEESEEEMTHAKYLAMKAVASEFYSQYTGQSWKNLISLGDMRYEHDAMQELTFRRMLGSIDRKEKIRTKTIILPSEPTLSEITLRLRFSRHMLKAYVKFNGDLDLDLEKVDDPVLAIAEALGIEQLASVSFSRHAWGRRSTPPDWDVLDRDLTDVEIAVHNALYD